MDVLRRASRTRPALSRRRVEGAVFDPALDGDRAWWLPGGVAVGAITVWQGTAAQDRPASRPARRAAGSGPHGASPAALSAVR